MRSSSSNGSTNSRLSCCSGLSVDQARDFGLNHRRHKQQLRNMTPTMRITAPYRPEILMCDPKKRLNRKRTAERVRRENALLDARCAAIKRAPPPPNMRPMPPGKRSATRGGGSIRRSRFGGKPKWNAKRTTNPGAMFAPTSAAPPGGPDRSKRDVSVRPLHYKARNLPRLDGASARARALKSTFVNNSTGSIYRKGHPALDRGRRSPAVSQPRSSAAALMARAYDKVGP